jgi:hypothetical protein
MCQLRKLKLVKRYGTKKETGLGLQTAEAVCRSPPIVNTGLTLHPYIRVQFDP